LCGSAFATQFAPSDGSDYPQRQTLFDAWRNDLRHLVAISHPKLLSDVSEFLDGAAVVVPDGDGVRIVKEGAAGQTVMVLVMFPWDRKSAFWNKVYPEGNIAARFLPEYNLLVLRSEQMAPRTRGMLLGHEGMHALVFAAEQNAHQTDEEYCEEEAIAHRLGIEVFRSIEPKFVSAVDVEAEKLAGSMRRNGGRIIDTDLKLDTFLLDVTFGRAQSELDRNYRATIFGDAVLVGAFLRYYNDDERPTMKRFSSYLCGIYKRNGIR
jgi:hypothetical protein